MRRTVTGHRSTHPSLPGQLAELHTISQPRNRAQLSITTTTRLKLMAPIRSGTNLHKTVAKQQDSNQMAPTLSGTKLHKTAAKSMMTILRRITIAPTSCQCPKTTAAKEGGAHTRHKNALICPQRKVNDKRSKRKRAKEK